MIDNIFNVPQDTFKYRQASARLLHNEFIIKRAGDPCKLAVDKSGTFVRKSPDLLYTAKATLFARKYMALQKLSHVMAGEIGHVVKDVSWIKHFFRLMAVRPDDITGIIAYYQSHYPSRMPNAMRQGFKAAFQEFDNTDLVTFRHFTHAVSLYDAIRMLRPRPNHRNRTVLNALVKKKDIMDIKERVCVRRKYRIVPYYFPSGSRDEQVRQLMNLISEVKINGNATNGS